MKIIKLFCALFFLSTSLSAQDLVMVQVASGFSQPVDIKNAGDDRLFIVERGGLIKIIDESGTTLSTPFLDIDAQSADDPNERGLLGLEFHPDYANNGYFYINYTDNSGDTRVSRYSVSSDPNVADASSEVVLLEIEQPFWNHNAGGLEFGPDGYLYIGTGDGGSGGDPGNRSQNPQNLLGKMLRIDVNNGNPYAIPADNPFANSADTLDEIWAIGLRNPWRFSFDSETGDFWIGDVGQNVYEEIDFEPANSGGGFNYGWRCYEGNTAFSTGGCNSASSYRAPVVDYAHGNFVHCSVTGGFVYRGCDNPDLVGHYVYADYCSGQLWSITPDGAGGWNNQTVGNVNYDISTFGEDVDGELYLARLTGGRIYKVNTANTISVDIQQADNTLTGTAGFDTYQWYLNGTLIVGATSETYEIEEDGDYALEVSNTDGCSFSSEIFSGIVGLENLESFEAFTVSPNPFKSELNVNMTVNKSVEVSIQIVDITGKVLHTALNTINGTATEVLKLEELAAGVYFVNLKTDEGTITRKVVKE